MGNENNIDDAIASLKVEAAVASHKLKNHIKTYLGVVLVLIGAFIVIAVEKPKGPNVIP